MSLRNRVMQAPVKGAGGEAYEFLPTHKIDAKAGSGLEDTRVANQIDYQLLGKSNRAVLSLVYLLHESMPQSGCSDLIRWINLLDFVQDYGLLGLQKVYIVGVSPISPSD